MIGRRFAVAVRLVVLACLLALPSFSGNGAAATGTWWLVDTHEHSAFSADARADLGVDAARAKSLGYNAVFLTDHDRLSSFQIEGANANYLSYSDALTGRWNQTTAGAPTSSANGVVSSPVHSGTSSLRLSLTAGSVTGRTFVYAKRGPTLRGGDAIIDFWIYPQQLSSGAGADVSVSLGGDTTAGSAYGYTTADGVTHLGKSTVLVWQLGSARAAASGGTNDVIVNQLSHTAGTWNHYVINVTTGSVTWTVGGTSQTSSTTGLAGLPTADRPADYAVLAIVKMEAAATPGATATAYFDDFVIRSSTPRCPSAEFVYRNGLVDSGTFNTPTFTIFPAREMGQGEHTQQFNFDIRNASDYYAAINDSNVAGGYGNDAAFCAATNSASAPWRSTDHGADNIAAVQASGYPTQSNHPGVTDTVANVIATQAHGADLLEVKSGPEYTSTWDAILQQNHVIPGTFGSDAHEGVGNGAQANFVYAPTSSLDDLLHAMYDGRTYMAPNTFAGRILFNLDGGSAPYPARYPVYVPAAQTSANVTLQITSGLSSGETVKWFWSSGAAPATATDTVSGSTYGQTRSIPLGNPFTYVRVAVYSGTTLIASTQPIFFEDVTGLPGDKSARVESVTPASGCRCSSTYTKGITSASWNASTLTLGLADPVGSASRLVVGSSTAPTAVTIDGTAVSSATSQSAFDAATGDVWFYDGGAGILHIQDRQASGTATVAATFGVSPPPPPPTGNGIALVQQKVVTLASGSVLTLAPSTATRTGDALVAAIAVRAGGSVTVTGVADSTGAGWTKGAVGYLSGTNSRVELWYRTGAPAVTSVTVTLSASNAAAVLLTEWSGVASASGLDRAAGTSSASGTTAATPSIATTNAADLVVGAVNYPAGVTSTLGAGPFSALSDFSLSTTIHGRAAYVVTSAAGSYRASWSLSGASGGSGGAALALKASSTTPPPPGDTTPPTTTIACNGSACGGTYTAPVSVTLAATDNASGSGVASTYYTTDGSDPVSSATRTTYSGAFTLAASAAIRFYSTDKAGNAEPTKSQAVTISTGGTGGTATFLPVADAYVSSDATTSNYGTLTAIRVDGSPIVRSYLRFAVSGLTGTVSRATLRIYANSAQTTGFDVYAVASTTWGETSVAYATAPALGAKLGSSGATTAGTWKQVDVTAAVAGNGTISFALATTSTTALSLGSRESPNAPQLIVETAGSSPPPAASLQVGAYWYGWYGSSGRHWQNGYVRSLLSTPQAPTLGEYDSRAAASISTQLGWMHQYGIDFVLSSWWGAGSYEDVTTHDYLLPSPALGATKVGILYESLSLLPVTNGVIDFSQAGVETKLVNDVDYLARNYFGSPGYLRVGGRPVVEFYVTRVWRGDYAHAIATLRSTMKQRYGYDLYLIGDEVDWDGTPVADRIKLFDAITAYTMYSSQQTPGWPDATGYLAGVRARYTQFKAVADQYGVRFIPNALPQFNDRGVRLQVNHYVLPAEVRAGLDGSYSLFTQFLDLDAAFLDPQIPTVLVTSWNEWHEDTEIEPTAAAGSSSDPVLYTQGYTYVSHGTKLLQAIAAFRAAHGG